MGAAVLQEEWGRPMLYDPKDEKYDDQFSVRAPRSLSERAERMKTAERLRSINEARVKAMRMGLDVYEFLATRADEVRAIAALERKTPEEVAVLLLSEALEARGRKPGKR